MPNRYYTSHSDLKITAPSKGAPTGQRSTKSPAMPYRCPDWGLHGLPTQKKNRSAGVREVPMYAKWEGLSEGGPRTGLEGSVLGERIKERARMDTGNYLKGSPQPGDSISRESAVAAVKAAARARAAAGNK